MVSTLPTENVSKPRGQANGRGITPPDAIDHSGPCCRDANRGIPCWNFLPSNLGTSPMACHARLASRNALGVEWKWMAKKSSSPCHFRFRLCLKTQSAAPSSKRGHACWPPKQGLLVCWYHQPFSPVLFPGTPWHLPGSAVGESCSG